jgi:Ankyrin repeats (3 copies)/Ankyrin repeats (many copies)
MKQMIENKNAEALRKLVESGVTDNWMPDIQYFPLLYCVYQNSFECAKILLEAKADVNGNKDHPPLLSACNFGRYDFVKLLIEHKADVLIENPNPNSDTNMRSLHFAANSQNLESLKLLFKAGASKIINIKAYGKYSPLYYACLRKHTNNDPFISILLDNGAKIKELYNPKLHHTLFNKRKNIKRTLIVFYHLGRKTKCLGKDVTNMIGKMVWETRDQDEWLMNQNSSKKTQKLK